MKLHEKTSNSYFRSGNRSQILRSLIASTRTKSKGLNYQKKSSVSVERAGNYVSVNHLEVVSKPALLVDDNLETIICFFFLHVTIEPLISTFELKYARGDN